MPMKLTIGAGQEGRPAPLRVARRDLRGGTRSPRISVTNPTASAAASAPHSSAAPGRSRRSWPANVRHPTGEAADDAGRCRGTTTESIPTRAGTATGAQVRALRALCRRDGVDLDALIAARADAERPEGLSAAEAGRLIDELQHAPADATA